MADRAQLAAALKRAHAAGDTDSARVLANAIRKLDGSQSEKPVAAIPKGPSKRPRGRAPAATALDQDAPLPMSRPRQMVGRIIAGMARPVAGLADMAIAATRPMEWQNTPAGTPVSDVVNRVFATGGVNKPSNLSESVVEGAGSAFIPGGIGVQTALGAGQAFGQRGSFSDAAEGAAWSAGGYGAGQAIGRGWQAAKNVATRTGEKVGDLGQAAIDAGLPVTPGQAMAETGKKSLLSKLEASFESLPWTGIKAAKISHDQKLKLSQSAGRAIGQNTDWITPQVLDSAADDIGSAIEASASKMRPVNLPPSLVEGIDKAVKTDPWLDITKTPNRMTASDYTSLRTKLSKLSRAAWKAGDDSKGEYVDKLVDRLDDIAELRGVDLKAHAAARAQWKMLRVLERSGVLKAGGEVSAASSKKALESVYGPAMKRGRTKYLSNEAVDFMEKSRALADLPTISDSGTITRGSLAVLGADIVTTGGTGTLLSTAGAYGYFSSPMGVSRMLGGLKESPVLTSRIGAAVGRLAGYDGSESNVEDLP